ncbi:MAG: hypothetical protein HZB23_12660 [Deltaproteobacteria bacterium]|nr:hypothetical protein [Deltaproteobacteria bacterium]
MYRIEADSGKNRLYVTLGQKNDCDELSVMENLKKELSKLTPGFTVLTDFSAFLPVRQDDAQLITKAQEILIRKGMGMSARVVNSAVVKMQVERRARETDFPSRTVETVEEAEIFLDAWQAGLGKKPARR